MFSRKTARNLAAVGMTAAFFGMATVAILAIGDALPPLAAAGGFLGFFSCGFLAAWIVDMAERC